MITVEVTQADIDAGIKESCVDCPIARAISRAVRVDARVGTYWVSWRIGNFLTELTLPVAAVGWIMAFDRGYPVEPFTFELEAEV